MAGAEPSASTPVVPKATAAAAPARMTFREEIRAAESLGKDGGLNEVCMLDPFVGFRRGVSVFRQEPAPPHQGAL
jgi:hypothetical protein